MEVRNQTKIFYILICVLLLLFILSYILFLYVNPNLLDLILSFGNILLKTNWLNVLKRLNLTVVLDTFIFFLLYVFLIYLLGFLTVLFISVSLRKENVRYIENSPKFMILLPILAINVGFGVVGILVLFLSMFKILYQSILVSVVLFILTVESIFLVKIVTKNTRRICTIFISSIKLFFKNCDNKVYSRIKIIIGLYFLTYYTILFYHSVFTPILHWDAGVYHATIPVMLFREHQYPLIAGPSIGIEMSSNYPPLFSLIGAFFFVISNSENDAFIRLLSPTMSILLIIAMYKVLRLLFPEHKLLPLFSVIILTLTPIYGKYSMYATNYTTLTNYLVTSLLILLLSIRTDEKNGRRLLFSMSCILMGFALLTSYQSIFFYVISILYLLYLYWRKKVTSKMLLSWILVPVAMGGLWYLRNFVLLGNPFYPMFCNIFDGKYIDIRILKTTIEGIHNSAVESLYGKLETNFIEKLITILFYHAFFPAISILSLIGLLLMYLYGTNKYRDISIGLALFSVVSLILMYCVSYWMFPRQFIPFIPLFSILVAYVFTFIYEASKQLTRYTMMICVGFIIVLLIFQCFLSFPIIASGKIYMDNKNNLKNVNINDKDWERYYWYFLTHPNPEKWEAVEIMRPDTKDAWLWLDKNLKPGEKFATIENIFYYIKNANNSYLFYLDGYEAIPLYNMSNVDEILLYLREHNVKYILETYIAWSHGHFRILPLSKYLSSPWFPVILSKASFEGNIFFNLYKVGAITDKHLHGNVPVSYSKVGWKTSWYNNEEVKIVPQQTEWPAETPKLYLLTDGLSLVKVKYLDIGNDRLSIHLRDLNTKDRFVMRYFYDYATIYKSNSGKWKTYYFIVPKLYEDINFAELALFTYYEDFIIKDITVTNVSYNNAFSFFDLPQKLTITSNEIFIYLPAITEHAKLYVIFNTSQVDVDVYRGIIMPWETDFQLKYSSIAHSNTGLLYTKLTSGLYTIVLQLHTRRIPEEMDYLLILYDSYNEKLFLKGNEKLLPLSKGIILTNNKIISSNFTFNVTLRILDTKPLSSQYIIVSNVSTTCRFNVDTIYNNISLEIFEGVIQPWEKTKWWGRHVMLARSPPLEEGFGTKNPKLEWRVKPGIYTLKIILWDNVKENVTIPLRITVKYDRGNT